MFAYRKNACLNTDSEGLKRCIADDSLIEHVGNRANGCAGIGFYGSDVDTVDGESIALYGIKSAVDRCSTGIGDADIYVGKIVIIVAGSKKQ